jgi:hypothetical protein
MTLMYVTLTNEIHPNFVYLEGIINLVADDKLESADSKANAGFI